MKSNKRASIVPRNYYLWPDENDQIILPPPGGKMHEGMETRPRSEPSALLSPRSQLSQRVRRANMSRLQSLYSSYLWRRLSSQIIYSFTQTTDHYFVMWLDAKLRGAEYGALSLAELFAAARWELGMRDERIIDLVVAHTRPGAEFRSDGVVLTFA